MNGKFKLPNCTEKKQFETSTMLYVKELVGGGAFQDSIPPCHEIQKIGLNVEEFDVKYPDVKNVDLSGKLIESLLMFTVVHWTSIHISDVFCLV